MIWKSKKSHNVENVPLWLKVDTIRPTSESSSKELNFSCNQYLLLLASLPLGYQPCKVNQEEVHDETLHMYYEFLFFRFCFDAVYWENCFLSFSGYDISRCAIFLLMRTLHFKDFLHLVPTKKFKSKPMPKYLNHQLLNSSIE